MPKQFVHYFSMKNGRKKMRKWILVFPLLIAIYFLPKIASTDLLKSRIENHFSKQLGGKVTIEKLDLSWNGLQKCQNVTWENPAKQVFTHAETIQCKMPFPTWFQIGKRPFDVEILGASLKSDAKLKVLKKKNKKLEISFDPICAQIKNGAIFLEKTSAHVRSSITVSIEGVIDLERSHLDLNMGMGEKTLRKLFKIQNLPEDYVLEIPLQCKMKASSIERKLLKSLMMNYATVMSLQR